MASDFLRVALISGRAVQVPASMDCPLKSIKLQAQRSLQTSLGILRDSKGQILDDCQTVKEAGLELGDALTLQVRQTMLASSKFGAAFAAMMGDGSVVTWGNSACGGDSSTVQQQLKNVQLIKATENAFAAVLDTGSVVTWGQPTSCGDSSVVQEQLRNVQYIQATVTADAFAAVLANRTVVTWGDPTSGGDSSGVQEQLRNVQHIQATGSAFAAVLDNGSVVTWGHPKFGGDSCAVQEQLRSVQHIQATGSAFAAVLDNGSVVTWGTQRAEKSLIKGSFFILKKHPLKLRIYLP